METDQLLPKPLTPVSRREVLQKNDDNIIHHTRRRLIAGAATLALVCTVHSVHRQRGRHINFNPTEQLSALQHLTEESLLGRASPTATKIDGVPSRHPKGRVKVISDKRHHHNENGEGIFHCTSRVMIMRHCDKEVKVKRHGEEHTTDMRDKHGDRHCSAKGKERSKYIATLFVDPDDYEQLVEDKGSKAGKHTAVDDGIPPVPMIKSSLGKVSSSAAKEKPQFPTPHKLYALSSKRIRDGKPHKTHDNFREIETITPLSDKFHLDVDERFGVEDEGDLASDFFEILSKSVTANVDRMSMMEKSQHAADSSLSPAGGDDVASLCNNGMTVVNWKHSRIPVLAQALGCGTNEGCPKKYKGKDFDTLWVLTFQYSMLVDGNDDSDVDASLLELESLSKTLSLRGPHERRLSRGNWKITAELVNEGFEPKLSH